MMPSRLVWSILAVAPLAVLACVGDAASTPDAPDGSVTPDASVEAASDARTEAASDSSPPDSSAVSDAADASVTPDSAVPLPCDPSTCALGDQVCCYAGQNSGSCKANPKDGGVVCTTNSNEYDCSKTSDCTNGAYCCATRTLLSLVDGGFVGLYGRCSATCKGSMFVSAVQLCDGPNDQACVKNGYTGCKKPAANTALPGSYSTCF